MPALNATRSTSRLGASGRPKKRHTGFQKLCFGFLFAVFALPQYFGIPLPGFALTAQRIMLILVIAAVFVVRERRDAFFVSNTGPMGGPIAVASLFIFVSLATAILRCDPKSFLNFFFDAFLPMLVMAYLAANVFTLKELLRFFKVVLVVVCVMCYLDALVLHHNPYDFMHTIKSVEGGSVWRAGSYRTAAMASHPIGLGLYFLLMTPLLCIDDERRTVNVAKNWGALLLVCGAVLLTGSRMPQLLFAAELIVLFLMTERSAKRDIVPYLLVVGTIAVLLVALFHDESHIRRYVILNLYQVIDSVLGTQLVLDEFGYWQWVLTTSSTEYRDLLPLLLLSDDYSPLLGQGVTAVNTDNISVSVNGRRIPSVDNYYVLQYMQFAWPGLVSIVAMFAYMAARCAVGALNRGSVLCRVLLVSFLLYFVNLWFVADLGTFKYAFTLFGLAYVYSRGAGLSQGRPAAGRPGEEAGAGRCRAAGPRRQGAPTRA